jgi:hypothetical protein
MSIDSLGHEFRRNYTPAKRRGGPILMFVLMSNKGHWRTAKAAAQVASPASIAEPLALAQPGAE